MCIKLSGLSVKNSGKTKGADVRSPKGRQEEEFTVGQSEDLMHCIKKHFFSEQLLHSSKISTNNRFVFLSQIKTSKSAEQCSWLFKHGSKDSIFTGIGGGRMNSELSNFKIWKSWGSGHLLLLRHCGSTSAFIRLLFFKKIYTVAPTALARRLTAVFTRTQGK